MQEKSQNKSINQNTDHQHSDQRKRTGRGFIERTLAELAREMEYAFYAEQIAKKDGWLQRLDPRVKVVGLLALIIDAAIARNLKTIFLIFGVGLIIALLSHIPLSTLAKRVWLGVIFFTGVIALPAIFITPGQIVYEVPWLAWPITAQGLRSASFLIARAETAATLSAILILTTLWSHVMKSLAVLGVPSVFIVILGTTYRYIFLLLQTAQDMFESRQSRMIGYLSGPERRRIAAASVGVLLGKTFQLSNDVYLAMISRGYQGEVLIFTDFAMKRGDWLALIFFGLLASLAFWMGR